MIKLINILWDNITGIGDDRNDLWDKLKIELEEGRLSFSSDVWPFIMNEGGDLDLRNYLVDTIQLLPPDDALTYIKKIYAEDGRLYFSMVAVAGALPLSHRKQLLDLFKTLTYEEYAPKSDEDRDIQRAALAFIKRCQQN